MTTQTPVSPSANPPSYTLVSRQQFAQQAWLGNTRYHFAASVACVPVVLTELPQLLPFCPLAFTLPADTGAAASPQLVAVMGLLPEQNLFVGDDGQWLAPYIPAVLRAYPFRLQTAEDSGQPVLCIREGSGLVVPAGQGKPFFDTAGQPSQEIRDMLAFLGAIRGQTANTATAAQALKAAELLEPWPLSLPVKRALGAGDSATEDLAQLQVRGLWRVREAALQQLAAEPLSQLRDSGALALAYAQLLAMAQLRLLAARFSARQSAAAAPRMPVAPSTTQAFQLPTGETLRFS